MSELRNSDHGIIEKMWWTVRTGWDYGYGSGEYPDTPEGIRAAYAAAKEKIEPVRGTRDSWTGRVSIELRVKIRWLPAAGQIAAGIERSIERREITLTEAEKDAKRKAAA